MLATSQSSRPRIACEQCAKAKTGCDKKEPRCGRCREKNLDCALRYARRTPRASLHLRRQNPNPHDQQLAYCNLSGYCGAPGDGLSASVSMFHPAGQLNGHTNPWAGARQLSYGSSSCASSIAPQPAHFLHFDPDGLNECVSALGTLNSGWQATPTSHYGTLALPESQGTFEGFYPASDTAINGAALLPFNCGPYLPSNRTLLDDGTVSGSTPSDGSEFRQDVNFDGDGSAH